ncbi:MAG: hypothetical protein COY58_07745 [Gammaproteobacteria bacterium CG_4_10_14_0_8_um_filter_38_16]|nr:MAG: hypothetical protein COY58_07745 [Gammaproteobacteria bacterium CG_4_10_14_0_8_um_filter_38_16]PJA03444.1 MAG: hypothetical protein COX72_04995 [Gammaproteobacteria bacterium CG_4_10_14_0_2_um_filter_38_22]PJB10599.1 MAG: hypothetical protein CO120_03885 [Gammaproteobacteria bacterium CG_4_9_14_3_um_filter_38_9]
MKYIIALTVIIFSLLSVGCGFHARTNASFPAELKRFYFSSERPYTVLSIQLKQLLKSMGAVRVKKPSEAKFTILITRDHFAYNRPDVVNSTLPTAMNYSQTVKISIIENLNHTMIASQLFTTSQSLTLNAGQIYTINENNLIKSELNRNLISLIYYWILSYKTRDVLHHASIMQSTQRAS